jgi:hypothetical protein
MNAVVANPEVALLSAFLREKQVESIEPILLAQEITSLKALQDLLADKSMKNGVIKEWLGEKPTFGRKLQAERFRKLKVDDVATAIMVAQQKAEEAAEVAKREAGAANEPEDVTSKANDELKAYLQKEGVPPSHVPVYEKHGVTSMQALQSLCKKPNARKSLVDDLRNGCVIGKKRYPSAPASAEQVENLSPRDLRDAIKNQQLTEKNGPLSDEFKQREGKLKEAVRQVEELRATCAKDASANAEAVLKQAMTNLETVLKESNSEPVLKKLKGSYSDIKSLDDALANASKELNGKVAQELVASLKDVKELDAAQLADANDLFRGVLWKAGEIADVSGSDLVSHTCKLTKEHTRKEDTFSYASQESYEYASKTVDRSASTFSTSNKLSGATFLGSGIGAISAAGGHARAKLDYNATEKAVSSSSACRIKSHKIWMTRGCITIPRDQVRLSHEASEALHFIATADASEQETYALAFLVNFGSHFYAKALLGGRYELIATATATTSEQLEGIDSAVSTVSNWQVSAAGSYVGLGGMFSGSSANQGGRDAASGRSTTERKSMRTEDVRTSTEVFGGLDQLSVDHWKQSLEKNTLWHVIDRDDPMAVWSLLALSTLRDVAPDAKAVLTKLLERVWVQQVFVPSLEDINPQLPKVPALAKATTVLELEQALAAIWAPPAMQVACFRERFSPASHFRKTFTLPQGYKILSGGVTSLNQHKGNFLVCSYPIYEPSSKTWLWRADMKDIDHVSAEEHEIAVLAVYDPDDRWDVCLFETSSSRAETTHTLVAGERTGYLITGGGAKVDDFSNVVITACGFVAASAAKAGATAQPTPRDGFLASSGSCRTNKAHVLTAIAIGIRARDGSLIEPTYLTKLLPKGGHQDATLTAGEGVIGGGACLRENVANFLTGSCPFIDARGTAIGWMASSKDHIEACHAEMEIVAVKLKNVKTTYVKPMQPAVAQ